MGVPTHDPSRHEARRTSEGEDGGRSAILESWILDLSLALGVDPAAIDRDELLATSRAAHGVTRSAAPFTIFLVGMAAGQAGGGVQAMTGAARTAQRLAAARKGLSELAE
jgi:hypothetical protein